MNLEANVRSVNGKIALHRVIDMVEQDPLLFEQLMNMVLSSDKELSRRAVWPMSYLACSHPEWMKKYYPAVIKLLEIMDQHPAIARNCFRYLQLASIPDKYASTIFSLSMKYIDQTKLPVAIRVIAMSTAHGICKRYPELGMELIPCIEMHMTNGSAGFRNRGLKILRSLGK